MASTPCSPFAGPTLRHPCTRPQARIGFDMGRWLLSPYLLLAVTALCWSGNHILARAMRTDLPPMAMAFWRWVIAAAVLLPFLGPTLWQHRAIISQHWRLLVLLAASGLALNHGFLYLALHATTAINTGLIIATTPIMIPLVALTLDRKLITLRQAAGIAVSLVGVVIIITRADTEALSGLRFAAGDLYAVVTAATWAIYSVLLRRMPRELPPLVFLLALAVLAVLLLLPFYGWEAVAVAGFAPTAQNLLALAYMGLFPSIVAYVCWNEGVAQVGPTKAGPTQYLIPVFTVVLAVSLLDEVIRPFHVVGAALAIFGVYLATSRRLALPGGA